MSHADHVSKLPNGFKVVASSKNSKFTIIENNKKFPTYIQTVRGSGYVLKIE